MIGPRSLSSSQRGASRPSRTGLHPAYPPTPVVRRPVAQPQVKLPREVVCHIRIATREGFTEVPKPVDGLVKVDGGVEYTLEFIPFMDFI
jgi:hypothetical protein